MRRFSLILALGAAGFIMGPSGAALAAKAYTVNTDPIALRASPSERGKPLAMIPPSSTVEPVNEHAFTRVFYTTPEGKTKEGWIPLKFLSAVPADASAAKQLGAENEALKAQVAQLQTDASQLTQKEKDQSDKLAALNAAYGQLKKGSADYLKLKADYDSTKAGLDKARDNIETLARENQEIKLYHNIQWFLAGGLVLLLGWIMGWSSTKVRKKRRQTYYL
ncbi:MAG: TIGR04211 family SH3 domain-containing protein [Syntrophobacteraceae bacterium]